MKDIGLKRGIKMAGKNNTVVKVARKPLPSAKKIATRGLYEVMWGAKPRNYEKRIGGKL